MDKDSTLSATDWFDEGLKCFNKPDAIVFYSHALTLDPYDEESLIGRGSCYTVKKNHEGALEKCTG